MVGGTERVPSVSGIKWSSNDKVLHAKAQNSNSRKITPQIQSTKAYAGAHTCRGYWAILTYKSQLADRLRQQIQAAVGAGVWWLISGRDKIKICLDFRVHPGPETFQNKSKAWLLHPNYFLNVCQKSPPGCFGCLSSRWITTDWLVRWWYVTQGHVQP